MSQLVAEHDIDFDEPKFTLKNDNESLLEIDPLDDFLQHVKEDIDVNNISGLFKIDLLDE